MIFSLIILFIILYILYIEPRKIDAKEKIVLALIIFICNI